MQRGVTTEASVGCEVLTATIMNSTMIWNVNMKALGSSETSVNIPQVVLLEANDLRI